MAIKVKVNGLEKLSAALKQRFEGTFSAAFNLLLAKKAADIVYKRTKAGRGVSLTTLGNAAGPARLTPLSPSYIEARQGKAIYFTRGDKVIRVPASKSFRIAKPTFGPFGSPGKSNLTYSGQMLQSISIQASARGFRVYVPNTKRSGSSLTNADVAKLVQDNGRPFFALTQDEIQILVREIQREVRKLTRRKL